ncbi:hypothetical protein F5I97DRAFT_1831190 [Phlebopus sp. FC_14]|nr:hypothetical protein F5I97DRAFT_1831190 [Phlebopus sp. FC_14]
MGLPTRLLNPAKAIFSELKTENIDAILMGGAAVIMNGVSRQTKDLDINVASFGFRERLHADQWLVSAGSSPERMRATYLHPTQAVKCDIATRPTIRSLLPYTVEQHGIRFAKPNLLVADKICAYVERKEVAVEKTSQDVADIVTLIEMMVDQGVTMPDNLKQMYLGETMLQAFAARLQKDDSKAVEDLRFLLAMVDVKLPT